MYAKTTIHRLIDFSNV